MVVSNIRNFFVLVGGHVAGGAGKRDEVGRENIWILLFIKFL